MKAIEIFLILSVYSLLASSQSIVIDTGAGISVEAGSDVCAGTWGHVTGNLTGAGTQCFGALPVEIISFTAVIENKTNVKISWSTAIEINNTGFAVEKKEVKGSWSKIAFIQGKGNSNTTEYYNYTDKNNSAGTYSYRLKQIDYNGNYKYYDLFGDITILKPGQFNVLQNYPNPSNPSTMISYQIPFDGKVNLKIFDLTGREVKTLVDENQTADYYSVYFDGTGLASGVYFYRLIFEGNGQKLSKTIKMCIIK